MFRRHSFSFGFRKHVTPKCYQWQDPVDGHQRLNGFSQEGGCLQVLVLTHMKRLYPVQATTQLPLLYFG